MKKRDLIIIMLALTLIFPATSCKSKTPIGSNSELLSSTNSEVTPPTGKNYKLEEDKFYDKTNYYCTWTNNWQSSTESWWKFSDLAGSTLEFEGKAQSLNWNNKNQVLYHMQQMKDAGIDVVIADLSNGMIGSGIMTAMQFCYENRL